MKLEISLCLFFLVGMCVGAIQPLPYWAAICAGLAVGICAYFTASWHNRPQNRGGG